jgi:hypothetical protein
MIVYPDYRQHDHLSYRYIKISYYKKISYIIRKFLIKNVLIYCVRKLHRMHHSNEKNK